MKINRAQLNRNVARFLQSSDGEAFFDAVERTPLRRLISAVVLLIIGVISLFSILLIPFGIRALRAVLRGLSDPWGKLRHNPDELYPLIAYGIKMGPQGHALVLGTFDESLERNPEFLAAKALELGDLYMNGSRDDRDRKIVKLLSDDIYHPDRRRRMSEPHAEGYSLYLFDIRLDVNESHRGPEGALLFACVATPGHRKGHIQQIPWRVVDSAVRF